VEFLRGAGRKKDKRQPTRGPERFPENRVLNCYFVTVSVDEAELLKLPPVLVAVTLYVLTGPFLAAVIVRFELYELKVTGWGLKLAVNLASSPLMLGWTFPVSPLEGFTAMVLSELLPRAIEMLVGADTVPVLTHCTNCVVPPVPIASGDTQ
jgi:hypothetical protein